MSIHNKLFHLFGLGILAISIILGIQYFFSKEGSSLMVGEASAIGFELVSPAFREGAGIPAQYTCKGQNISPPLQILGSPENTKSYVLIMHDPDAVNGDFVHWLMWDIPPSTNSIMPGNIPVGAVQGINDAGQNTYTGPCPPKGTGTHRYMFELYALDTSLSLPAGASREEVKRAMQGRIMADTKIIGLFTAD